MKENSFDRVAPFYDGLTRLVFGKRLEQAQLEFVSKISEGSRVLILGGGTGWFLEKLVDFQPNLQIDYVEASEKMIALSQQRNLPGQIRFIHGTQEDIPETHYDVIITHFFLDVFTQEKLRAVIKQLKNALASDGLWLCTDFRKTGKPFHAFLLWFMHRFFRITTKLQAREIQDFQDLLTEEGLKKNGLRYWRNGLIFSAAFRKS